MNQSSRIWALALIVFGVGFGLYAFKPAISTAQPAGGGATPKYSVIETDGTNLLIADNASNTLYYYTVDADKAPGDDLKLRGSIDMNDVGKPVMKPKVHKQ